MRRSQRPKGEVGKGTRGVTLLEVLVAAVVTAIGFTAIVHFLLLCVVMQTGSEDFWRKAVEKWNRAQDLRSQSGPCAEEAAASEAGADGLQKFELEGDEDDEGRRWEVIVVCREGFHAD